MNIKIGCSSYQNYAWRGIFYPDDLQGKYWFEYYCQHFNTFEINATFYTFPTLRVMENWRNKAPEDFVYSVKAPKLITHTKRFIDCVDELQQFYEVCQEGLQQKLGCILFQMPPSFEYSDERLDLILQILDTNYRNVIEFRNISWWRNDLLQSLDFHRISFCSVSYPALPEDVEVTAQVAYFRFHGNTKLFYSGYSNDKLKDFYSQLCRVESTEDVYIYFNNTAGQEGIIDALKMKKIATEFR
ncbi:MAG TPA: DUF72 domain-containing protein [Flavobacterium sp.]|jgi:uncharacterized protein YecE (DUF72 family)|nr:DUF72 domain-containing protein [Flavobacterium sp.]